MEIEREVLVSQTRLLSVEHEETLNLVINLAALEARAVRLKHGGGAAPPT